VLKRHPIWQGGRRGLSRRGSERDRLVALPRPLKQRRTRRGEQRCLGGGGGGRLGGLRPKLGRGTIQNGGRRGLRRRGGERKRLLTWPRPLGRHCARRLSRTGTLTAQYAADSVGLVKCLGAV